MGQNLTQDLELLFTSANNNSFDKDKLTAMAQRYTIPVQTIVNTPNELEYNWTLLHYFTWHGNVKALQFLLENGANLEAHDVDGETAAFQLDDIKTLDLFIKTKANLQVTNKQGETILFKVTHAAVLDRLLPILDNNHVNKKQETILHVAVRANDLTKTRILLLKSKTNINAQDVEGNTILHIAATNSNQDMLQLLLEHNLHAFTLNCKGQNAEDLVPETNPELRILISRSKQKQYEDLFQSVASIQQHSANQISQLETIGNQHLLEIERLKKLLHASDAMIEQGKREKVEMIATFMTNWIEIDPSELDMGDVIGNGMLAETKYALWRGFPVAVKILYNTKNMTEEAHKEFVNELKVLAAVRSPHLVMLMGACTLKHNLMLVNEYLHRESLHTALYVKNTKFSNADIRRIAQEVAYGLHYLHQAKPQICHRDLKSPNILLYGDTEIHAKIGDFGLYRTIAHASKSKTMMYTPAWLAPEVLLGTHPYDDKADIYSYGMVLYELVARQAPFENEEWEFTHYQEHVGKNGKRPTLPDTVHPSIAELINKCWTQDRSDRPTTSDIVAIIKNLVIE